MKILGYQYIVNQEKSYRELDTMGQINSMTSTLEIANDLSFEQERSTILHEVIHAVSFQLGLDLTEQQVRGLETGLNSVLSDNSAFLKMYLDV